MIDRLAYEAASGRVSARERVEQAAEKARRLHGLNAFISLADGAGIDVCEQRRDDQLLAVPIAAGRHEPGLGGHGITQPRLLRGVGAARRARCACAPPAWRKTR